MTAAAGATGVRSWIAARGGGWLTARRLRAITVALLGIAFAISAVGFSGSGGTTRPAHADRTGSAGAR